MKRGVSSQSILNLIPSFPHNLEISPLLRLSLLLDIMLRPALLGLANIMLSLVLGLLLAVADERGRSAAELAREAVLGALAEVLDLAAGLLLLAFAVFLTAGLLELL